jgi:hypothetical protein
MFFENHCSVKGQGCYWTSQLEVLLSKEVLFFILVYPYLPHPYTYVHTICNTFLLPFSFTLFCVYQACTSPRAQGGGRYFQCHGRVFETATLVLGNGPGTHGLLTWSWPGAHDVWSSCSVEPSRHPHSRPPATFTHVSSQPARNWIRASLARERIGLRYVTLLHCTNPFIKLPAYPLTSIILAYALASVILASVLTSVVVSTYWPPLSSPMYWPSLSFLCTNLRYPRDIRFCPRRPEICPLRVWSCWIHIPT